MLRNSRRYRNQIDKTFCEYLVRRQVFDFSKPAKEKGDDRLFNRFMTQKEKNERKLKFNYKTW